MSHNCKNLGLESSTLICNSGSTFNIPELSSRRMFLELKHSTCRAKRLGLHKDVPIMKCFMIPNSLGLLFFFLQHTYAIWLLMPYKIYDLSDLPEFLILFSGFSKDSTGILICFSVVTCHLSCFLLIQVANLICTSAARYFLSAWFVLSLDRMFSVL